MEDQQFDPVYPFGHYVLILVSVLPGVLGLALCVSLALSRQAVLVSVLLTLALPLILRARHVKRVVFGENLIVVRQLFRDRYYNYTEFRQVEPERVVTTRGVIHIGDWVNRRAFLDSLRLMRKRGLLDHTEFDRQVLEDDT